jgi:type I restriction enzyme M protein
MHRGKVLFINAKHLVSRMNGESFLTPEHITEIASIYNKYEDVGVIAKIVSNEEIRAKKCSFSINIYARGIRESDDAQRTAYSISELMSELNARSNKLNQELEKLNNLL